MKLQLLGVALATMSFITVVSAEEVKQGNPKTGMFMYANTVNMAGQTLALPVLKTDEYICTTYIASSKVKDDEIIASYGQYCDPVVEEPIILEDGSEAKVITSNLAGTFQFNRSQGRHQFEPSDEEDTYHVLLSDEVYQSFILSFEDRIEEFVTQRDTALAELDKNKK